MSFKMHLLVICIIIAVVSAGWWLFKNREAPVAPVAVSDRFIQIVHASWGLNCKGFATSQTGPQTPDTFITEGKRGPFYTDNVLLLLSQMCNGKVQCAAWDLPKVLPNPMPACSKELEIEYRCFEFDRPWRLKSKSNSFAINCLNPQ